MFSGSLLTLCSGREQTSISDSHWTMNFGSYSRLQETSQPMVAMMHWSDLTARQATAVVISLVVSAWMCVALGYSLYKWYVTSRLYGGVPLRLSWHVIRWTLWTKNARRLFAPWGGCILVAAVARLTDLGSGPIIAAPCILAGIYFVSELSLPPSVLVLGSSNWQMIRLVLNIHRGIFPYRPMVLLDPAAATNARSSRLEYDNFEYDNLRIIVPHDWQEVVFALAEAVPLIVLDTRTPSPAVVEEVRRILGSNLRNKTIFLVHNDGTSPAVKAVSQEAAILAKTCKASDIVTALRNRGLSRTVSPWDNPLYGQISTNNIAKKMQRMGPTGIRFAAALERAWNKLCSPNSQSPCVREGFQLYEQLTGGPGATLANVVAGLDSDIRATESFIEKWSSDRMPEHQQLVEEARTTLRCLTELQVAVDAVPPNFITQLLNSSHRTETS